MSCSHQPNSQTTLSSVLFNNSSRRLLNSKPPWGLWEWVAQAAGSSCLVRGHFLPKTLDPSDPPLGSTQQWLQKSIIHSKLRFGAAQVPLDLRTERTLRRLLLVQIMDLGEVLSSNSPTHSTPTGNSWRVCTPFHYSWDKMFIFKFTFHFPFSGLSLGLNAVPYRGNKHIQFNNAQKVTCYLSIMVLFIFIHRGTIPTSSRCQLI